MSLTFAFDLSGDVAYVLSFMVWMVPSIVEPVVLRSVVLLQSCSEDILPVQRARFLLKGAISAIAATFSTLTAAHL